MNQVPSVQMAPCVAQQVFVPAQPQPQPKLNAVNIEINNPSVGNQGAAVQPQCAPNTVPVYNYPQAPIYTYPTAQAPVCCPPCVQQPPVNTTVPQQINVNYPPVPPTVTEVPTAAPTVPEPSVSQEPAAAPTATQKPEVTPAEQVSPQVDVNAFISKLANPDFEGQAAGMEEIANVVKTAPEKANELLVDKIIDSLTNIINYDSSALQGPTKEQVEAREKINTNQEVTEAERQLANQITPKEQAERNKSYALFTLAILDKHYGEEAAKLSNKTVSLVELPGAVTIVDNLKDNPNPMVRSSAIEALSYIQKPEYKKDLTTVFTVAANDADPGVSGSAKAALEKLNQI